jgi:hypothetical protein
VKPTLLLATLCVALPAAASNPSDDVSIIVALGPPATFSLLFDGAMLTSLLPNGTVGRGYVVNGLVFGAITATFAGVACAVGCGAPDKSDGWKILSALGLAVGVGTIAFSVYGYTRPPADAVELPALPKRPGPPPPPASPVSPDPPQLRVLPFFGRGLAGASLMVSL